MPTPGPGYYDTYDGRKKSKYDTSNFLVNKGTFGKSVKPDAFLTGNSRIDYPGPGNYEIIKEVIDYNKGATFA